MITTRIVILLLIIAFSLVCCWQHLMGCSVSENYGAPYGLAHRQRYLFRGTYFLERDRGGYLGKVPRAHSHGVAFGGLRGSTAHVWARSCPTSENSVWAKFAELPFHALGWIWL